VGKKPKAQPVVIAHVVLDGAAERALAMLPKKFRGQIARRIDALVQNPHPTGSKKLHGEVGPYGETLYRERSGDYRIVYVIREQTVVVLDVDDRKDVFR
jgi:mRNA interferase RelE/StbE